MNLSDLSEPAPIEREADTNAVSTLPQSSPSTTPTTSQPDGGPVSHPRFPGLSLRRVVPFKSPGGPAATKPVFRKSNTSGAAVSQQKSEPAKNDHEPTRSQFTDFDLPEPIQEAIRQAGYTQPSPIQAAMIPPMLDRRDVIAQSQTGSGKTAAFAIPVLANLDHSSSRGGPQTLVLAPTRELAMQVASSFEKYAGELSGFSVTAIYGGADYEPQKRALKRGVNIVVGTPGRVIDHVRRGTLRLDSLNCLVLDEADEMLNMGFLEDVEFVLQQCPDERQIALFSATMPAPIRRIADQYLDDPHSVTIKSKAMTADSIRQRAILTTAREKIDLLKRVLESEDTDGVIVFAKTKESTSFIAEKLVKAGHTAAALNGDMAQATRQRTVGALRSGKLDIIVATDVAARGLDVPRISHVINFDLPHDRESYVHRIGRTGRAGRSGEAILFLAPSERGRLRSIEQMTKQPIEMAQWPSVDRINERRIEKFKTRITETLAKRDVTFFEKLIAQYMDESAKPLEKVAAALAEIAKGEQPFLLSERAKPSRKERGKRERNGWGSQADDQDGEGSRSRDRQSRGRRTRGPVEPGMRRYRVEVGRADGVKPGNLVGAIANEGGLESQQIGPIHIDHHFTTVDLPAKMSGEVVATLKHTRVMGKQLNLRPDNGPPTRQGNKRHHSNRPSGGPPSRGGRSKSGFGGNGKSRKPKRDRRG